MARLYLASCLTEQDFTSVAVRDSEPVGVIMCKDERKHRTSIRYWLRCTYGIASMLTCAEGRRVSSMFKGFNSLDKELLRECGQSFDGQLAFFAIRSDQRGTGIGRKLFEQAQIFMKSRSMRNFYLYTDVTCNFGFYEHNGMTRLNERKYSFNPRWNKDLTFFLYGYSFESDPTP